MRKTFYRICAAFLIPLMAVLNCPISAVSAETPAIEIEHNPIEEATAGERIAIEVEIVDESGIKTARVYFKASEAAEYSFVVLESENGEDFTGTLPAPANGAGGFEYLILVQNGNNEVVKSQTYMVTVEDDDDAAEAIAENDQIQVYTELEQAPTEISGFSDNIAVDVVESAAKLGVVAGLYSAATAGSSSSGAIAAGTVTATAGGISTTALVIGGVVAAAAVGGAAAASSSSDDDGGSAEELTSSTIVGSWSVTGSSTYGSTTSGTITFNNGGSYTYTLNTSGYGAESGSGTWTLSGSNLNMRFDAGAVYNGTATGNSRNFTMNSSNGWTLNFSR